MTTSGPYKKQGPSIGRTASSQPKLFVLFGQPLYEYVKEVTTFPRRFHIAGRHRRRPRTPFSDKNFRYHQIPSSSSEYKAMPSVGKG